MEDPMAMEDSLLARQFDEYRIVSLLGHGGMARVYRGIDTRLERYVAIKVIDTPYRQDSTYVERFQREARVIAQLNHPNVVQLYRYGEQEGLLYMVMQYIEGVDLGIILQGYRRDGEFMTPVEVVRIFREICQALDYIHSKGVIHRDIKPSNVMLDKDGHAILTDFGISLLTEIGTRGEAFGSPHYIAPEQAISSANVMPQTDFYAVGVMLYQIFTGQLPFDAADPMDIALKHISDAPPLPRSIRSEISPEVEAVILKLLAKTPQERYPDGKALIAALEGALFKNASQPQSASSLIAQQVRERAQILPPVQAAKIVSPGSKPIPQIVVPPKVIVPSSEIAPPKMDHQPNPQETGSRPKRSMGVYLAAGGLVILALICLVGLFSVILGVSLRAGKGTETVAGKEAFSTTMTSQVAVATDVTPNQSMWIYELKLIRQPKVGLFVINTGADGFVLGPLLLGNGSNQIVGAEWGVQVLDSSQCVVIWRANKKQKESEGPECELVGKQLESKSAALFGDDELEIYYNNIYISTCEADDQECEFQIVEPKP
jgi:serine/threonine protein kinase